MPCRICLCFIETKSKIGDYEKNPYNFRRSWIVEVNQAEVAIIGQSQREKFLEEKLQKIEKQFEEFQQQQNKILEAILNKKDKNQSNGKGKGKGKGKKSTTPSECSSSVLANADVFQAAVEQEAQRRLRRFIENSDSNCLEQNPSSSQRPPPSIVSNWTEDEIPNVTATKTIFIKKIEVTLNGIPIDLVEDKETEDQVPIL